MPLAVHPWRHPREVSLDQLHRVQGRQQPQHGTVEALQSAHGPDARFHVAMIPFAAIGRDHQVLEPGGDVLGPWCARVDRRRIEGRLVSHDVLGCQAAHPICGRHLTLRHRAPSPGSCCHRPLPFHDDHGRPNQPARSSLRPCWSVWLLRRLVTRPESGPLS